MPRAWKCRTEVLRHQPWRDDCRKVFFRVGLLNGIVTITLRRSDIATRRRELIKLPDEDRPARNLERLTPILVDSRIVSRAGTNLNEFMLVTGLGVGKIRSDSARAAQIRSF
jgi:hypothetical protein